MTNKIEEGEWSDMDSYDWVNYIDEYHCTDYWTSVERDYDGDFFYDEDDDLSDDDCGQLVDS